MYSTSVPEPPELLGKRVPSVRRHGSVRARERLHERDSRAEPVLRFRIIPWPVPIVTGSCTKLKRCSPHKLPRLKCCLEREHTQRTTLRARGPDECLNNVEPVLDRSVCARQAQRE